jgi:hypothetical protein
MRRVLMVIAISSGTAWADNPTIARDAAERLLYLDAAPPACGDVECLLARRYADDDKAKTLAVGLYRATGDIAGVGPDETMDGGYRGRIHLVPQLPIRGYRQHLAWVAGAMTDIDAFFTAQFPDVQPAYRWRALGFRFVRSVGKRTPSAYASSWAIEYNVEGSLLTSATGVRETLFHELFHLNDEAHRNWSKRTLERDYEAIVAKCGTKMACLEPYAPNDTYVRGGTYYAFQPNNGDGVHEYAAELAVRYYKEQSEMRSKHKLAKRAFKCGPAENARSWQAFVAEFFAGVDLVPPCK